MSKSLNLCFFWHMHQPDYRGSNGVMTMPWVFLHAIKDYYEMPWLVSRHPGLKATFNITAPLIEQLNLYSEPLRYDYFLSLWEAHPSALEAEARSWLVKTCKSTQFDTMVQPFPRYGTLYHQDDLNDEELIDLEVLFILSWCGNYLRQENKLVRELIEKGEAFSQSDKTELLKTLCDFVATILPFYASLQKQGVISLSTTPYNHPILPLLLDIDNAKHANAHTPLPDNSLSLRDDAIEQVNRSIMLYEETFGRKPTGFWPAEGAVDEASVAIYKEKGLKWIATDEAILFRSLEDSERANLYSAYNFNDVTIGFRDHGLSDLIGFTYRFKGAEEAAEHFMQALKPIAQESRDATVFVILDGENAWEFFADNAYPFFNALYQRFADASWCHTVTMDEVSQGKDIPILDRLAPGSWINGEFNTWSGHQEKNRAWELIYQTRRDVDNYLGTISDEVKEKVTYHFLAAECSDWFWWYGDDHVTDFAFEFDALFREHLITIYTLLDMRAPADLYEPIITHKSSASFMLKPNAHISPIIDGKNSSFFEWLDSGSIDETQIFSTMDRVRGPMEKIYFGQNDEAVFLAFEGEFERFQQEVSTLEVIIEETAEKLFFALDCSYEDEVSSLAVGERIELALQRSLFKEHGSVHLRFEIVQGSHIIQTLPGYGSLVIDLDETFAENWFV
ncbi:MAG: glycoside hydrolase family 57 protein [Campylobacterota bacterium]|nr:glycoside hydrolase family 57 protein [Campylobacterota bacterium]